MKDVLGREEQVQRTWGHPETTNTSEAPEEQGTYDVSGGAWWDIGTKRWQDLHLLQGAGCDREFGFSCQLPGKLSAWLLHVVWQQRRRQKQWKQELARPGQEVTAAFQSPRCTSFPQLGCGL